MHHNFAKTRKLENLSSDPSRHKTEFG